MLVREISDQERQTILRELIEEFPGDLMRRELHWCTGSSLAVATYGQSPDLQAAP